MKFRKGIFSFLILLLAFSPVLGLFADEAEAASSRVAVIQSMKGTVYVKKAGGSKEFKAYAKMSLNEGDVLRTGANSSAVLQFSNGTSEDDRMSVSAGTTLTFSKLSDRNGTRTKVSMFNGTAWVDVKSIATKNDEFTLETPTAVMGVRGTHLLVSVDPLTGATRLTVVAGVVHTQPTGDGEARDVKPGDNALIVKDEQNSGEVVIAPADLDLLMQQSDSSIVEAIVTAAAEIMLENQEKLDQYFEGEGPAGDLERMKSNIENLVGAIVDSAIRNGVITEERANELIAEAQAQTGVTVDLSKKTLNLTEEERLKQEEQKRKQEEAARKAAEELRAKEEQRRQNEELLKRLEEVRKAKEEANRQAEEKRIKNAVEEYKSRLSDAEKQRFEADQQNRAEESSQNQTGSQPGTAPGAPSSNDSDSGSSPGGGDQGGGGDDNPAQLSAFELYMQDVNSQHAAFSWGEEEFDPDVDTYEIEIDGSQQVLPRNVHLNFETLNREGYIYGSVKLAVKYGDEDWSEDFYTNVFSLPPGQTILKVTVQAFSAQNQSVSFTHTYTFNITRVPSANNKLGLIEYSLGGNWEAANPDDGIVLTQSADSIWIKAVPEHPNAASAIVVDGESQDATQGVEIPLESGENSVTVKVTAESGDSEFYTMSIFNPERGGDQGGGSEEDPVPSFLSDWEMTAGGNTIEWADLSEEDAEFYKLDLDEKVEAAQMTLYFDDENYKILAIRPHDLFNGQEYDELDELGIVIASWNTSGMSISLPLMDGINSILLIAFDKNESAPDPEKSAMLLILNGEQHVYLTVNEQMAGKIGDDSYIAAIPENAEAVILKAEAAYDEIYDFTVSGENGAHANYDPQEGTYLITWPGSKTSTVTNLTIGVIDLLSGKQEKSYTLTLVEGDSSALDLSEWEIYYLNKEPDPYENVEFEGNENYFFRLVGNEVSFISLTPLSEMFEYLSYDVYMNGQPLTVVENQIEFPLDEGVNEVTFVARPMHDSSPVAVYVFNFWRTPQKEELEDVRIDGESIFDPENLESIMVVQPEQGSGQGSVTLSLDTNLNAGKWLVYDKQAKDLIYPVSQNAYTLQLQDGWNEFKLYSVFGDHYLIKIYYGIPLQFNNLEFYMQDDETQNVVSSWNAFNPSEDHHVLTFDGSEQVLPDEVNFYLDYEEMEGFTYDIKFKVRYEESGDWTELEGWTFALPPGWTDAKLIVKAFAIDNYALVYEWTYTFGISRVASENADLQSLQISHDGNTWEEADSYSIQLTESTENIWIKPVPVHGNATAEIITANQTYSDATQGVEIQLGYGENPVTVKVIAESGDYETYTYSIFNPQGGGSGGAVPGFLSGWETTAGGSQLEWIGFGDEENLFYKLDLQETEEIQLALSFDDTNYRLEAYSLYGVEDFYDEYPSGLAQGSWTTSGTTRTLMVETGTNLYLLAIYPKDSPEEIPANKALLLIQNGNLPINLNLYVDDDQYDIPRPARIGANSFIAPIPVNSPVVELFATYNSYGYVPMEVTVTGDNGVIITETGEGYPYFELSWNPDLKEGPVTHLNIQANDLISGLLQESYTLTLVEGDYTSLQLPSLKVKYPSNGTEVEEYLTFGNYYDGSMGIEDSSVSSIGLEPMGNDIGSLAIELYHNGKPITDWSNVPIYHVENVFDIVVRHANDSGPEAPLSVYTAYVFKEYPQDWITDLQIDGESVFQSGWYTDVLVSPDTESVSFTFETNGTREWLVYDGINWEFIEPAQNQYTLELNEGWNIYAVYYAGPISCECAASHILKIYRGTPAVLDSMELYYMDDATWEYVVYWDEFNPLVDTYNITIDIPEDQMPPDYLDIDLQTPNFVGFNYVARMSVNQGTPISVNGNQINLATGMNTVELEVQARSAANEQVVDIKTYTFNIERKPSKNADLSSVTLAVYGQEYLYDHNLFGTLNIELYESATAAELVQVAPLDWKSVVQYSINGSELENFTEVATIPLQLGNNTLKVRIIAENGNYKDYDINIFNPSGTE